MRFPKTIVITADNQLLIDDKPFPYYIENEGPRLEHMPGGFALNVPILFFRDDTEFRDERM